MRKNKDIRIAAMERGVYFWQIASWLCITPESFSRLMRKELDEDDKKSLLGDRCCGQRARATSQKP